MSTFDNKSAALTATGPAASTPEDVPLHFSDVLKAVDDAPDLTHRVRQNLRIAVNRTAMLMSQLASGPIKVVAAARADVILEWRKEFRHERSVLVVGGAASPDATVLPAIARHTAGG